MLRVSGGQGAGRANPWLSEREKSEGSEGGERRGVGERRHGVGEGSRRGREGAEKASRRHICEVSAVTRK